MAVAEPTAGTGPRTFVLVHGAWHGGWCWRRVADLLRAKGHRVFTPTLTGLAERSHLIETELRIGLDTHVSDIAGLFRWEQLSDVVLCGHSYGGMVISGVAERMSAEPGAVRSLVYLDAFLPRDGEALVDLAPPLVRERIAALTAEGARTVPQMTAAYFHVNEADRSQVDALSTPHPLASLTEPVGLTGARERVARRTYVRAVGYPNVAFDAARQRAEGSGGWKILELPCGHDAMLDLPEDVARILIDAA